MRRLICASFLACLLVMPGKSLAQQKQQLDRPLFFETGIEFSTGDFGTARNTSILAVPLTLGYRHRLFEISATIPYLHLSTTGFTILTGGGPAAVSETKAARTPTPQVPAPTPRNPSPVIADKASKSSTSGMGDLRLQGIAFLLEERGNWPSLSPWLTVKIPTANEDKGLGSGKTDVGLGAVVAKTFGRSFASIDLGYTFIGEPKGVDFDNVFSLIATLGYSPLEPLSVYGFFDFRTAVVDKVHNPASLGLGARYLIAERIGLKAEVRGGVTDSAPDVAGTMGLEFRF